MLTLRLDKTLEYELEKRSKEMGISKSEVVRLSLKKFLETEPNLTPWELGKDLFGAFESGDPTLSQNKREKVSKLVRAKKG